MCQRVLPRISWRFPSRDARLMLFPSPGMLRRQTICAEPRGSGRSVSGQFYMAPFVLTPTIRDIRALPFVIRKTNPRVYPRGEIGHGTNGICWAYPRLYILL